MGGEGLSAAFESDVVSLAVSLYLEPDICSYCERRLNCCSADLEVSEVEKHNDDVRDDLEEARKEVTQDGTGDLVCQGGIIVLVPTDKPISEWQPIAGLELPHVMWHWPSGL